MNCFENHLGYQKNNRIKIKSHKERPQRKRLEFIFLNQIIVAYVTENVHLHSNYLQGIAKTIKVRLELTITDL